ncbi:MlaD family protein [Alphaproteobacteria bacterium]|nr:MlaD family protein [Alphaproteobacteria bacterium]
MNKKISFEFIIGLLILIITFISFVFFALKTDYFDSSNKFNLNSQFFDIGSLTVGADVKSKGVKIGEVIEITLDDETYMALVKSSFNNNLKIPIDSEVKIANNGFIGSPFVEITMGNNELFFQNNDITENNVDAVSLEEIINNFIFN